METFCLKGYVDHIVFRNQDNGYTVLELVHEGETHICVGHFQSIDEGETIEVTGHKIEHPSYGEQIKVETYVITVPEDIVSIERYLGSGAIRGIGPALAARIVKKFKLDTFRIMEEEPERLSEVKGISERKAIELGEQVEEKRDQRQAMIFLQKYGITTVLAVKIYEKYGTEIYTMIKENPYRMADEMSGIGFRMADEIASKVGIHTDSDYRIRSGILYMLFQGLKDGHVYLPEQELLERCRELLKLSEEEIQAQLANLMMDKKIIIKARKDQTNIYEASLYYTELNCARMLFQLQWMEDREAEIWKKIEKLEGETGLCLEELQRQAVIEAVKNGIFIISGGPGTGKTTTINMLIQYFEAEGLDFMLAAPTGRAAKRMTEATGYEASTIHRLLEVSGIMEDRGRENPFERNEQYPLETDAIIIDEMSMVDIHLFNALLKAVTIGTRLILVGDRNQLPSVGPGSVLKDMMESNCFPTVILKKIYRQANTSDIVVNAHKINAGEPLNLNNANKDFFFLEREDIPSILGVIVYLVKEKLPGYVKAEPYDIQVMTPMRKGHLGVENLNKVLQMYLNPSDERKIEKEHGNFVFREGDKVMQVKNNYQLDWDVINKYGMSMEKGHGIFNGDMGIIKKINSISETVEVEFDEYKKAIYTFKQLDELELAYAITIHKSQGSEYPAVIIPILSGPKMLFNRNLLYTGVTRAKSCVTLVGSGKMIQQMIENGSEQKRYTSLTERIKEIFEEKL